ncbi:MAG: DUF3634 family protein [Candidatus Aegiribacteria sp.]|nr:DUF3634 family protein [Candidatus Aegiribacteria sp.]
MTFLKILFRKLFPPLFTIRIKGGTAIAKSGKLTSSFLGDCTDIVRKNGISSGWIWGYSSPGGARMKFSSEISKGDMQRFRNVAGVHGL